MEREPGGEVNYYGGGSGGGNNWLDKSLETMFYTSNAHLHL
jgi:hypothetical protein